MQRSFLFNIRTFVRKPSPNLWHVTVWAHGRQVFAERIAQEPITNSAQLKKMWFYETGDDDITAVILVSPCRVCGN